MINGRCRADIRMKKLVILALVLLAGLFPGLTVLASPPEVPHRDPAQVPEEMWLDALFLTYAGVFDLVGSRDYRSAQDLLAEIGKSSVPDDLRYLVQRGTALGLDLTATLDHLELLLDEASGLVKSRQLAAAASKLYEAEGEIEVARESLAELQEGIDALSRKLVFGALSGRLGQAYERVTGSLKSLEALIEEFDRLRREIDEARRAELRAGLTATVLEIDIRPSSVFWGENINVSGNLTGGGAGLIGRDVSLLIGGHYRTVTTRADGSYSLEIAAVPGDYSGRLTAMAVYQAAGEDVGRYLPSQSRTVTVGVSFNPTRLEVTAPMRAFAGQPVTLTGRIVAGELPRPRTVNVSWDGEALTEGIFNGAFSIDTVLPPGSLPGDHALEVAVLPEGSYAGAARRLPLSLWPGTISAEIKAPAVVFTPRAVRVSGRAVAGDAPLVGATVNVGLGEALATARTAADGSFQTALEVPFELALAGSQELDITIIPGEPWLRHFRATPTVVMVNPVIIGVLALISLIIIVRLRIAVRPAVSAVGGITPAGQTVGDAVGAAVFTPQELSGGRREVLSGYLSALELVARVCGTAPAPHTTIREYLAVARRLNGAYEPFRELTGLAELVLYAPRGPDESLVARSVKLVGDIKRELRE